MFWWFLAEGGFLLSFGILKKRNSLLFTFHRYTKAEAVISNGHVHLRKAFCRAIYHTCTQCFSTRHMGSPFNMNSPFPRIWVLTIQVSLHAPSCIDSVSCDKLSPYRQLSPLFQDIFLRLQRKGDLSWKCPNNVSICRKKALTPPPA